MYRLDAILIVQRAIRVWLFRRRFAKNRWTHVSISCIQSLATKLLQRKKCRFLNSDRITSPFFLVSEFPFPTTVPNQWHKDTPMRLQLSKASGQFIFTIKKFTFRISNIDSNYTLKLLYTTQSHPHVLCITIDTAYKQWLLSRYDTLQFSTTESIASLQLKPLPICDHPYFTEPAIPTLLLSLMTNHINSMLYAGYLKDRKLYIGVLYRYHKDVHCYTCIHASCGITFHCFKAWKMHFMPNIRNEIDHTIFNYKCVLGSIHTPLQDTPKEKIITPRITLVQSMLPIHSTGGVTVKI